LDVDGEFAVSGNLQDVLFKSITINSFVFELEDASTKTNART
jgi:hypothetical protein